MSTQPLAYESRGARALVLCHERCLREFVDVWHDARQRNIDLPQTDDSDYRSLDHLLWHVLRAARGYMMWICGKLELPDPGIQKPPGLDEIAAGAGDYLEHLLQRWSHPLEKVEEQALCEGTYESRWGVDYCVEAMLEHAIVHPMRHALQLKELMKPDP